MAAITQPVHTSAAAARYLRPFDASRDLAAVADLVELCFADTLDADGERYLQHMRSAAANPGFLRWAAKAAELTNVPMNGYVWEQDGRIIGNLSIISYNAQNRRYYLIANVAVHPDYRRQGIGRDLTLQGIEHARRRNAHAVWLHVRENNPPAVKLYESLGFVERALRTTWNTAPEYSPPVLSPASVVGHRRAADWPDQQAWLTRAYPDQLTWHLPLRVAALRPGLGGMLYRALTGLSLIQWSVRRGARLHGSLTWQAAYSHASSLWLAAPPDADEDAITTLLLHARQRLPARRALVLDYPARQLANAIRRAGFYEHQTLMWMEIPFR